MSKRKRSDAAKRGWETRRRRKRSDAAKRGWETRRRRERESRGITSGPPGKRPPRLPVYDIRDFPFLPGTELGYARTLDDAWTIAETERPDDELESVDPPTFTNQYFVARYRAAEEFEPSEEPEDMADEWEIGFEYRGADHHSHVDVNFRIARKDGQAFTLGEAERVFREFRANLGTEHSMIPAGYLMAWIDWKRPSKRTDGWRGSDDDVDLEAFFHPMYISADDDSAWKEPTPYRLGSVKYSA